MPIWATAPTPSDNAAEPLTLPSLAMTVRGYVAAAAVETERVMLPLLEEPGDWMAPAPPPGNPCPGSATFPGAPLPGGLTLPAAAGSAGKPHPRNARNR